MLPKIAITLGDPAGIGPEIVAKAMSQATLRPTYRPVVVGSRETLEEAAAICGLQLRLAAFRQDTVQGDGVIEVLDPGNLVAQEVRRGVVSAEAGRAANAAIEQAARLALDGDVAAITTAPINKEAISRAGFGSVGHTELLARFCGVPDDAVAMMLASSRLRVVHVTTHVSMLRAIELLSVERIATTARLAAAATKRIIGREPRIAVAGLNPHAGEHGLFGHEDGDIIGPAVDLLRGEGFEVTGPIPPDTVFLQAIQGRYDVVVAQYHDQGHIPSKLQGLDETVNVTLGLPIVRTSVDHGTAFDIAWTGRASETNLLAALEVAASLVRGQAHVSGEPATRDA